MRKIRTTNRPDQEIEVSDAEYLDLERQGLIHRDPEPEPGAPEAERQVRDNAARRLRSTPTEKEN